MDERTLELLRVLQSGVHDRATFDRIETLLQSQRASLAAADDRATSADLSELLEMWAEAAPVELGVAALGWAASIAERELGQAQRARQLYTLCLVRQPTSLEPLAKLETLLRDNGQHAEFEALLAEHAQRLCATEGADPALLAGVYRRLGDLRATRSNAGGRPQLDATIKAYEQALDLSADVDVILLLADLYARRGAPGDAAQAAEFYCTLGDVLGEVEGLPMLERALDALPSHHAALELLERYVPAAEQGTRLAARWAAYIEHSDDETSTDLRRMSLARAYVAQEKPRDALVCLSPLCEKGEGAALVLQAKCLTSLRSDQQQNADTPTGARPATLVGFPVPPTVTNSSTPKAVGALQNKQQTLVGFTLPTDPKDDAAAPHGEPKAPPSVPARTASQPPARRSSVAGPPPKPQTPRPSSTPPRLPSSVPPAPKLGPSAKAAALRAQSAAPPVSSASVARAPAAAVPSSAGPTAARAVPATLAPIVTETVPVKREGIAPAATGRDRRWLIGGAGGVLGVGGAIAVTMLLRTPAPLPPAASASRGESVAPQTPVIVPSPIPVAPSAAAPTQPTPPAEQAPAATQVAPAEPAPAATHVAPASKLIPGTLRVKGGNLTVAQIEVALGDTVTGLERCYQSAQARVPELRGQLTYAWTVDKAGHPLRVHRAEGTLKSPSLEHCSIEELKKARFPKPKKKPAQVSWPIRYGSKS